MTRYVIYAIVGAIVLGLVFLLAYAAGAALALILTALVPVVLIALAIYAWVRWGRHSESR